MKITCRVRAPCSTQTVASMSDSGTKTSEMVSALGTIPAIGEMQINSTTSPNHAIMANGKMVKSMGKGRS